jgi:hypothetical protein
MEIKNAGMTGIGLGSTAVQTGLDQVKRWAGSRPAAFHAARLVVTSPAPVNSGAELCLSPDRGTFQSYRQAASGVTAAGNVPTTSGSHRPAPPG